MPDAPHESGGECRSCPVCLVSQALHDVHPDVRRHLAAAGRELLLALRAAMAPERDGDRPWASPGDMASDTGNGRSHEQAPRGGSGRPQEPRQGSDAAMPRDDVPHERAADAAAPGAPRGLRRIDIT